MLPETSPLLNCGKTALGSKASTLKNRSLPGVVAGLKLDVSEAFRFSPWVLDEPDFQDLSGLGHEALDERFLDREVQVADKD